MADEIEDGVHQGHYPSGELQWECPYENGERHGTLRFWFEDGMLQSQREYMHGMKHGPFRDFHPDGRVAAEGEYRGDELIAVREWDKEGNEMPGALARWQQQYAAANAPQSDGSEINDPAWQAKQMEVGELFMVLWLSPWRKKRDLMLGEPELTNRLRHMFTRLLIDRMPEPPAPIVALAAVHQPLIDMCDEAAKAARRFGMPLAQALDLVFDNQDLWMAFHEATGQPQE